MSKALTALTVAATVSATGVSASNDMLICQMVDTLVWTIDGGFPSPTEVEEYQGPYDVLVKKGELYLEETIEGGTIALVPIKFDKDGWGKSEGFKWFKVSETEFRIVGQEFGGAWTSTLTCPDEM